MNASTAPGSNRAPEPNNFAFGSKSYAWVVVAILCGLQFISNMERQILTLAVEPLKRDFQVSDVQFSLLQGFAFALFYSLIAVPAGWLADRWRRKQILIISMTIWVVATIGCMVAHSYGQLFAGRLLVGFADAALIPATFSLLSDYFPRARLAGPVGAVTGSTFLGTGASMTFGGMLLSRLPVDKAIVLPVFGAVSGWQVTFGIVSLVGLVFAATILAVREPPRRTNPDAGESNGSTSSISDVFRYLVQERSTLGALIGGIVLLAAYQYGLTIWAVTLFIRKFGWEVSEIGLLYGLYFMIIGTAGSGIGGRLCDWLQARGRKDANFLIPLAATAILLPTGLAFTLSASGTVSAMLLGVITLVIVIAFGPAMAAVPALVPATMRAQMTAITLLATTLVGAGGGPWLVAMFTDHLFRDPQALPLSLALCVPLLLIPTAIVFARGRKSVAKS